MWLLHLGDGLRVSSLEFLLSVPGVFYGGLEGKTRLVSCPPHVRKVGLAPHVEEMLIPFLLWLCCAWSLL